MVLIYIDALNSTALRRHCEPGEKCDAFYDGCGNLVITYLEIATSSLCFCFETPRDDEKGR